MKRLMPDAEVQVQGDTVQHGGQEGSGVSGVQEATAVLEPPTVERETEPCTGQADFSLISSCKLESFPSAFGRSVVKKAPVVMMNMPIHPPGTNVNMQQMMRSRLPSASSVSEGEVPTSVERVMDARMGVKDTSASSVNTSPPSQQQQQQQCQPLVGQEVISAGPTAMMLQPVLQAKDQNVMPERTSDANKAKLIQSSSASQMQPARGVPLEEEEPMRNIEGDPFYSGAHL